MLYRDCFTIFDKGACFKASWFVPLAILATSNCLEGMIEMYRIPDDLDLTPVEGEFTTQVRVGQFDLQFTFGTVNFAVQSPVNLFRGEDLVAHWEEGRWPEPGFYDIMNAEVKRCEIVSDRLIVIEFENAIVMHLEDSSDEYESMQISFEGDPTLWVI